MPGNTDSTNGHATAPAAHGAPVAWSAQYIYALPEGHRFPIDKYILVKEQLVYEGIIAEAQVYDPGLVADELITRVHSPQYWQQAKTLTLPPKMQRRIGLPLSPTSVNRARNSVAGTVSAAEHALTHGLGINLAGGTHHAYIDKGEGFCLLNDVAIAAAHLLHLGRIKQALVVDLDVHQGNGTASIFAHDTRVFTFSMHGADNYPLHKEQSDLDLPLPTGTTDGPYLDLLHQHLPRLIDKVKPNIIFFVAGVDVLANDRLGRLALSPQGCRERDAFVAETAHRHGIPLVTTMGGGYSHHLAQLVNAHSTTIKEALKVWG